MYGPDMMLVYVCLQTPTDSDKRLSESLQVSHLELPETSWFSSPQLFQGFIITRSPQVIKQCYLNLGQQELSEHQVAFELWKVKMLLLCMSLHSLRLLDMVRATYLEVPSIGEAHQH